MRAGVLLLAVGLSGCRMILGLDDPRLVDAAVDEELPDTSIIDTKVTAGCPDAFVAATTSGGITGAARYYMLPTSLTFQNAAMECTQFQTSMNMHTHLVVLSDNMELTVVWEAYKQTNSGVWWIGLNRITSTAFQWVTAESTNGYPPSSGAPWAPGEPDGGTQACVATTMDDSNNAAIEDALCASTIPALCECDGYQDEPSRH